LVLEAYVHCVELVINSISTSDTLDVSTVLFVDENTMMMIVQ